MIGDCLSSLMRRVEDYDFDPKSLRPKIFESTLYSKIVQSETFIQKKMYILIYKKCFDWLFFEYEYKNRTQKIFDHKTRSGQIKDNKILVIINI